MIKKIFGQQIRFIARTSFRLTNVPTTQEEPLIEVTTALNGWDEKLKSAGVGDIEFNLKCIVAHVLKKEFSTLRNYNNVVFNAEQMKEFQRLCEARCARMPLQYIVGEWDFLDLTLKTAPTVFIPRSETEEFVKKVIEVYRSEPTVKMLEVGCGSGAMSLAILNKLKQVHSTAIERSKAATVLAAENAHMLGLQERFVVYNHTMEENNYVPADLKDEKYDLIISNPPYVRTDEFQHLNPEVIVYENLNALDGGSDGLQVARLVFKLANQHLRPGGKLWLELGVDHPPMVMTIMETFYQNQLKYIAGYKDQYERERFVEIEKI